MTPRCPTHDRALVVEDQDRTYGQTLLVCPERGCRQTYRTGPSDAEIYRREVPR